MNRRSFLATLASIAVAPKALERLAALRPVRLLHLRKIPPSTGTLQRAYRKMQAQMLDGFHLETAEWDGVIYLDPTEGAIVAQLEKQAKEAIDATARRLLRQYG